MQYIYHLLFLLITLRNTLYSLCKNLCNVNLFLFKTWLGPILYLCE